MRTINSILSENKLTVKEIELLTFLNDELQDHLGSGYSDVDCKDISRETKMSLNTVKGVVGSLVKKDVLRTVPSSDIGSDTYDLVFFIGQDEMEYEKVGSTEKEEKVVDERLVDLNKITKIPLSIVYVKKRPFVKAQRIAAKYIIENWDNAEMLSHLVNDKEFKAEQELVCGIAEDRLKELTPAEEKKPIEEPKKKPAKKAGRKVVRKVGDIHKNGLWFWKEYKPGKFDWRVIKK